MKSVVLILALAGLLAGQVPPLSPDVVPTLPPLPAEELVPQPQATVAPAHSPLPALKMQQTAGDVPPKHPPAMVPVTAGSGPKTVPPQVFRDPLLFGKPPAFKLVDLPPAPDIPAPTPAPAPAPAPLPPCIPPAPKGEQTEAAPALPPGSLATPCLVLQRTGPTSVKAGQSFAYEIIVRNAGSVPAKQARLEEELPPGTRCIGGQPMALVQGDRLSWNLEDLAPGAERRIKVEVEATSDGEWVAHASLTVSVASAQKTQITAAPSKCLEITAPVTVPMGHPVVFPIRITNTTGAPLVDVVLRVHLSTGLQHLEGDGIEAPLGDLAVGQSKSLTLDAIALQTGKLTFHAILLTGKKALAETNVSLLATEQPVLVLRQTGSLTPRWSTEEQYKVEVVNRSPAEVRDVVVSDLLPQGLQYVSGESGAAYEPATRAIRWNLGKLPPGEARQLTFRATVLGQGAQVNRVTARTGDGQEAQLYTILRVGLGN